MIVVERNLARAYPEMNVGGFSSVDGTVEFYARVNALLNDEMTVLDFGAGRGAWYEDDVCEYRKRLRLLKGKVARTIACDIDDIVLENRSVDESLLCEVGEKLSLDDASIDVVIADYVLEHVTDTDWLSEEFERVLRPGGWICARTPCKHSYVALAARLISNRAHGKVLAKVQPSRKEQDVFPTQYKLNTLKQIRRVFPDSMYENWTYYYEGEPAYYFGNLVVLRLLQVFAWLAPNPLHANLFVFLRKRPSS